MLTMLKQARAFGLGVVLATQNPVDLDYKGFDFGILLQGIGPVNAYTQNAWTEPLGISGGTITDLWTEAWSSENPHLTISSITINNISGMGRNRISGALIFHPES